MKTIKKGDLVSLQSLSSGIAGEKQFIHKYEIGKERIKHLGLKPVSSPNALKGTEFIKNNPKERASDFMEAINDEKISMIIANIGGFDSHMIIPYLDADIIKNKPKPLLGYSDITSLHLFLYTLGVKTYYGPTVLSGFAENVKIHDLTLKSLNDVIFDNKDQKITSSKEWTSEYLEWANEDNNLISRKMIQEEHGHIWLNFKENVEGHLIGGCLDTIVQIKNESFFPKTEDWVNSIIFSETSESKMNPSEFEKAIKSLKTEISVASGIIFGKPKDETFFFEYLEIIKKHITKPVVFNLNFGHTAPMHTIPYGRKATFNFGKKEIIIKGS